MSQNSDELNRLLREFQQQPFPEHLERQFEQINVSPPDRSGVDVQVGDGFSGRESTEDLLRRLIDVVEALPDRIVDALNNQ